MDTPNGTWRLHRGDRVRLSARFRKITGARDDVCVVRSGPDKAGRYEVEYRGVALWPLADDLVRTTDALA